MQVLMILSKNRSITELINLFIKTGFSARILKCLIIICMMILHFLIGLYFHNSNYLK